MDKPLVKGTPDAIVVVNASGTAVDCNNAFAKLCGMPAGMLVGQQLSSCAPELAEILMANNKSVLVANEQVFDLDVQPFTAGAATGDQFVRLRVARFEEVA